MTTRPGIQSRRPGQHHARQGAVKFYFTEVARNKSYVEPYDASRQFTFRAYNTRAMLQQGPQAKFEEWHIGKWVK